MQSLIDPSRLASHLTGYTQLQLLNKLAIQTGTFYRFTSVGQAKSAGSDCILHVCGDRCCAYAKHGNLSTPPMSLSEMGWTLVDEHTECSATQIRHWSAFFNSLIRFENPCHWMKKIIWMADHTSDLHIADFNLIKGAGFTQILQVDVGLALGSCLEPLNTKLLKSEWLTQLGLSKRSLPMAFMDLGDSIHQLITHLEQAHQLHLPYAPDETACAFLLEAFETSCDIQHNKILVITSSDAKEDSETFEKLLKHHNKQLVLAPLTSMETLLRLLVRQVIKPYMQKEANQCH